MIKNIPDPQISRLPRAEPFLRWAGGKRQLVRFLVERLPYDVSDCRYVEPFLGAGSLFFAASPKSAVLGDANAFLIAAYEAVKKNPLLLRRQLSELIKRHDAVTYYQTRKIFNRLQHSSAQSARFIYLNKACFNGIFRVNRQGHFNVPKGSKDALSIPSSESFQAIAAALQNARLLPNDFTETLALVTQGDFVYLDPPYPALNDTSYFNHYTADRFDSQTQRTLAERVKGIHEIGAKFLMSNADVPLVRQLYAAYRIEPVPVMRYVTANGTRVKVSELLISNYCKCGTSL